MNKKIGRKKFLFRMEKETWILFSLACKNLGRPIGLQIETLMRDWLQLPLKVLEIGNPGGATEDSTLELEQAVESEWKRISRGRERGKTIVRGSLDVPVQFGKPKQVSQSEKPRRRAS